jgi:hypothetical protein
VSFELQIDLQFETPKFDEPEIKVDPIIPGFQLSTSKVDIRNNSKIKR